MRRVEREQVGTGQMGTCYRLRVEGDPALPATVLVKLPAADPASRALVSAPDFELLPITTRALALRRPS